MNEDIENPVDEIKPDRKTLQVPYKVSIVTIPADPPTPADNSSNQTMTAALVENGSNIEVFTNQYMKRGLIWLCYRVN